MPLLLLHTPGWKPGSVAAALAADGVETRSVWPLRAPDGNGRPTVLLIDAAARHAVRAAELAPLVDAGIAVIALGSGADGDDLAPHLLSAELPAEPAPRALLIAVKAAFREAAARSQLVQARAEAADRTSEVTELTAIGIGLLTERNHRALLGQILTQARRVTQSDAGTLYLVDREAPGEPRLRVVLSQNDSRPDIPFAELTLPLDTRSIAGYSACTAEPLALDDAHLPPPGAPYSFNPSFDDRYGYRTKSMLTVPMSNHAGDVIGVLQLINRKREPKRPFSDAADVERRATPYGAQAMKVTRALAGQAAVSLENSQLYESIERLFEGFVRAAVTAIEQRDPTTSGHSERVAGLTVALATVVDGTAGGRYAAHRFSASEIRELRYAALLHDFGKLGVRERVLVKGKKLYTSDLARIRQRHAFVVQRARWQYERARADYLEQHGTVGYADFQRTRAAAHAAEVASLDRFLARVMECNEPSVVDQQPGEAFAELQRFSESTFEGPDGIEERLLTPAELASLSVRQGSLDAAERREIESHVAHTYRFLERIPWTRELRAIPAIAHAHHEKLDGSGYPRRLRADQIPLPARIMTIADIYDALTAADRPYKHAVPTERALDILNEEVRNGALDADLYRLFVDAKVYEAPPA